MWKERFLYIKSQCGGGVKSVCVLYICVSHPRCIADVCEVCVRERERDIMLYICDDSQRACLILAV